MQQPPPLIKEDHELSHIIKTENSIDSVCNALKQHLIEIKAKAQPSSILKLNLDINVQEERTNTNVSTVSTNPFL